MATWYSIAVWVFSACGFGWAAPSVPELKSFTVYSEPLELKPGQVHNRWSKPLPLPADIVQRFANKTMYLKALELDIVRKDWATGQHVSAPLFEIYNHHHALLAGDTETMEHIYNNSKGHDPLGPKGPHRMRPHGCMMHGASMNNFLEEIRRVSKRKVVASFGGASGAEFRGTSTELPAPYVSSTENPQSFMSLIHFINMRGAPRPSDRRFECPCTKARHIDPTNGTVDGEKVLPFACSLELLREKNTACSLSTYKGGYRCCEDGVFLTEDAPGASAHADIFHAKFTFSYYEEMPEARVVHQTACCDATGNVTHKGNIEYDIPQCAAGTPPEFCEHVISAVQTLDDGRRNSTHDPDEMLELVHAWGHQHLGALGMELYNEQTGQLLCKTKPRYGTGSEAGNEAGFLVGIEPCVWGRPPLPSPPRLRRSDLVRTIARYNSSTPRHGVMSLWLMSASPVSKPTAPDVLI